MPDEPPLISPPAALGPDDIVLLGRELSRGAVEYVCTNPRYIAEPFGWYRHPGNELSFMLHGATGYRFEHGLFATFGGYQGSFCQPSVLVGAERSISLNAARRPSEKSAPTS